MVLGWENLQEVFVMLLVVAFPHWRFLLFRATFLCYRHSTLAPQTGEGVHQLWALPWLLSVALLLPGFSAKFYRERYPSKHSSWGRPPEDVLKTSLVIVFRRRLDQDEYVLLTHTSSEDVFKTSSSKPIYSPWSYIFKTSSKCFQDVFKTSSKRLPNTSSRRLQDIFKTSSRHLQDIFKTYYQVKLFLVT